MGTDQITPKRPCLDSSFSTFSKYNMVQCICSLNMIQHTSNPAERSTIMDIIHKAITGNHKVKKCFWLKYDLKNKLIIKYFNVKTILTCSDAFIQSDIQLSGADKGKEPCSRIQTHNPLINNPEP